LPAITDVEFRQFSANHHNAQRNWLLVKLNTDDPAVYGIGDASPMQDDEQVKDLITGFVEKYLRGKDPLESSFTGQRCIRTRRPVVADLPPRRFRA